MSFVDLFRRTCELFNNYPAKIFVGMVLSVVSAQNALGQGPKSKVSYEFSVTPLYQPSVNIKSGGEFSLASAFFRLKAKRAISPTTTIGISLKYDIDDYEFSGVTDFGGRQPWKDVRRFGIGFPLFARFQNDWSLGVSPSVDWLQEYDAASGDSLSYGATAFVFKSLARDKSLGVGAGVFRTIDDETKAFPFIAVDWRFNERWRLANPFEADALGPAGLELSYRFSDKWHLGGGGVYRSFRFRLSREGGVPDGIGVNEGIATFLRLRRIATSGINVDFYVAAILDGNLELKNKDGRDLSSTDYDTAPFAAITFTAAF